VLVTMLLAFASSVHELLMALIAQIPILTVSPTRLQQLETTVLHLFAPKLLAKRGRLAMPWSLECVNPLLALLRLPKMPAQPWSAILKPTPAVDAIPTHQA
jgi:hypothetical protein